MPATFSVELPIYWETLANSCQRTEYSLGNEEMRYKFIENANFPSWRTFERDSAMGESEWSEKTHGFQGRGAQRLVEAFSCSLPFLSIFTIKDTGNALLAYIPIF